jgi:hypothetical protein
MGCRGFRLTLPGFHLAAFVQRKMELNDGCSPDLSNDRRQNDFAGWHPALGSFYSRAPQQAALPFASSSRDPALAIAHSFFDLLSLISDNDLR